MRRRRGMQSMRPCSGVWQAPQPTVRSWSHRRAFQPGLVNSCAKARAPRAPEQRCQPRASVSACTLLLLRPPLSPHLGIDGAAAVGVEEVECLADLLLLLLGEAASAAALALVAPRADDGRKRRQASWAVRHVPRFGAVKTTRPRRGLRWRRHSTPASSVDHAPHVDRPSPPVSSPHTAPAVSPSSTSWPVSSAQWESPSWAACACAAGAPRARWLSSAR
eukprot:360365-Chlamydomonas_euryale.AAC.10